MKKENKNAVSKWLAFDNDGTIVAFHSNPDITIPPKEFIEQIRQYSFDNPDAAVMILSGRKDEDLTKFYQEAFKPNEEGVISKVVLASENGAFLRISTDPERLHKQAEPLSDELKENIKEGIKKAAGECYCEKFPESIDDKIRVRLEMKNFGLTLHYRIPPEKTQEGEKMLANIKGIIEDVVREKPELHPDFNAASAFTLELVSKGVTMKKLAEYDPTLVDIFEEANLSTGKTEFVSYIGDDRGDWPALNILSEFIDKGIVEGYTARPNNYSPTTPDVATRVPNGPKETGARDAFYILGNDKVSAQQKIRQEFLDKTTIEQKTQLRKELHDRNLMPSQSSYKQTPPIVLLGTGDILIQEPDCYDAATLDNLRDWSHGKVVLTAANEEKFTELQDKVSKFKNENLIVVSPQGKVFANNQSHDLKSSVVQFGNETDVKSKDPKRAAEIKFLRVIQKVLNNNGFTKRIISGLAKMTGLASVPERKDSATAQKPASTIKNNPKSKQGRRMS